MTPRAMHDHQAAVPRLPIAGMAVFVVAALVAVAAVRYSGVDIHEPDAPAAVSRSLRFEDRPDGRIVVFEATSGAKVDEIQGEAGFVRGTLRGLARERRREGVGAEPPFELIGRTDGRLTLVDPSTGRHVDLESFGPTNAATFARLLAPPPQK